MWKWTPGLPIHCLALFPLYQTIPQTQSTHHIIPAPNIFLGSSRLCELILFICDISYSPLVVNLFLCVHIFSSIDGKLYLRTRLSLMLLSVPYNTSIVHWAWRMDGGRERKRERAIKKCKKISFSQIIYIQIWHHRKQQLPVRSVICQ